jgi:BirA family biotin operon repressor/biotin-[acetyl-CoA-carboxylase] ligase
MNFNFPYLYLKETESTNIVAFELLSKTNPANGFLVITDYQTAGKGQYGRNWQSEADKNLLFSLILGPLNIPVSELFKLHIATSLTLIRTFKRNSLDCTIKWPNDIYAGSKKMAGILIQNQLKGNAVEWSVIGIGINVNQTQFPSDLNATSMVLETGNEADREQLVAELRLQIMDLLLNTNENHWSDLLNEYNMNLYLKGQQLLCIPKDGRPFSGIILNVEKDGSLRIQHESGETATYSFGEIQYSPVM